MSGYGFDTFGRIKNHRWKASGGTLLAGWSHDYDRIGNKKYQEDLQSATQSELYGYDDVYRVTGFKRGQLNEQKTDITSPSRTQTWALDPLGNWDDTVLDSVTESRTHNSVNELTARTIGEDPEIGLSYDAAGNLTQDGDSNGDHKYTWDYRNRLIEVEEKQSGNWNTTGDYKYDARNRRILKTVTNKGGLNGTTRFIWGGSGDWQCLEERDGSGDLVARFTYAPGYVDAVAVQERDLNSDDDFGDANEVVYCHSNTLASVYALSDGNESVIERYRYDAYGACTVLDADGSADADGLSDVENPYTFTGRRLDPESRLMQYRNRYYHTGVGRFVSRDPMGYTDAYGLYLYGAGRPCAGGDPMGLQEYSVDRRYWVAPGGGDWGYTDTWSYSTFSQIWWGMPQEAVSKCYAEAGKMEGQAGAARKASCDLMAKDYENGSWVMMSATGGGQTAHSSRTGQEHISGTVRVRVWPKALWCLDCWHNGDYELLTDPYGDPDAPNGCLCHYDCENGQMVKRLGTLLPYDPGNGHIRYSCTCPRRIVWCDEEIPGPPPDPLAAWRACMVTCTLVCNAMFTAIPLLVPCDKICEMACGPRPGGYCGPSDGTMM